MTISEIFNYFLGSTTIVSIYIAWQSRKSEIKKAETTALQGIQEVYDKFVIQTNAEFEKMKLIIEDQNKKIIELEKIIKSLKNEKN